LDGVYPFSEGLSFRVIHAVLALLSNVKLKTDCSVDGSVEIVLTSFQLSSSITADVLAGLLSGFHVSFLSSEVKSEMATSLEQSLFCSL
jgi:hypothetical protein